MHFEDLADDSGATEFLAFHMRSEPCKRPVDCEQCPRLRHRGDHAIGFGERSGEGFLYENGGNKRRDFLNPLGMTRGRGAENDEIRFRLEQTGFDRSVDPVIRNGKDPPSLLHPRGRFVTDRDNFGMGMLVRHAQQIAHVKMVEVHSRNTPLPHS